MNDSTNGKVFNKTGNIRVIRDIKILGKMGGKKVLEFAPEIICITL